MGLRDYFGKNEKTAVSIISILFFIAAISGIISYTQPIGTAYTSVDVTYKQIENNIEITEKFNTRIGILDKFNVLYRSFEEPICLEGETCNFIITDVTCEKGTAYVSKTGKPLQPQGGKEIGISTSKIEPKEIGCYNSKQLTQEKTSFSVTYIIPLSHVQKNDYKHIFFSKEHFAINKLIVQGLEEKSSSNYLPANEQIEINVQTGKTNKKNVSLALLLLIAIAFGSIPYLIWKKMGTEKHFIVPEYMHAIPTKQMKPWQVDVLINGKLELSKNGMASILMELYTNKIITVEKIKKTFKTTYEFHVDTTKDTSTISEKAKIFLGKIKENKIRTEGTNTICVLPTTSTSFNDFMKNYFKGTDIIVFTKKTLDKKGYKFVTALQISPIILFIFFKFINIIPTYLIAPAIILTASIFFMKASMPASVFCRFKEDNYKTYLEWLAFNKMLKDYAQIKKYMKEDHLMWKEWLVYATAMGSAKNVLKSLKELNILSPIEYERTSRMYTHFYAVSILSHATAHPKSSGSGGMGGGGGFGGGGGGGR